MGDMRFLPKDKLAIADKIFSRVFKAARISLVDIDKDIPENVSWAIVHGEELLPPHVSSGCLVKVTNWVTSFCSDEVGVNETSLRQLIDEERNEYLRSNTEWYISIVQKKPLVVKGEASAAASIIGQNIMSLDFLELVEVRILNAKTRVLRSVPLKHFRLHEMMYKSSAIARFLKDVAKKSKEPIDLEAENNTGAKVSQVIRNRKSWDDYPKGMLH